MEDVEDHPGSQAIAVGSVISNRWRLADGFELGLEALAPAFWENPDLQHAPKQSNLGQRRKVNLVQFRDGHNRFLAPGKHNLVPDADFAFADDGQVKTTEAAPEKTRNHVVAAKLGGKLETRKARRRHLYHRRADAVLVSHTDLRLDEPFRSEVFAKSAPWQLLLLKFFSPVGVVLGCINIDSLAAPAVYREIRLAVAIEIHLAQHNAAISRLLEDSSFESGVLPGKQARQSDINGDESHLKYQTIKVAEAMQFWFAV
jgi:hypothetical protein